MEPLTTRDLFAAHLPSRKPRSRRRASTATWLREHYRPTDGPDAGKPLRLEPWQRDLLAAIDRERKPIVAIRAASQIGKTLLCLGVGMRAAVEGKGVLIASATEISIRDMSRRLESVIDGSPELSRVFPSPRSGPGARASWKDRRLVGGGWMAMAASGSASQLASRTAAVGIADECSRWPRRVRSGEGHPLALLRARLLDWGDESRLLAISSPVLPADSISLLYRDGDRRRLDYPCPDCGVRTALEWEMIVGRERGETPGLACPHCGVVHDEAARRRMLRHGRWTASRENPTDEDVASFTLSRLDSARATLVQITREWRRARLGAERGDPAALKAFRNTILGLPSESGAADVDRLFEGRQERFSLKRAEQVTAGVDVQNDRLYVAVLAFAPHNAEVWVLASDVLIGDPREPATWTTLEGLLARPYGGGPETTRGLRVSVVSVDAGFLTSNVTRESARRRWWVPTVGRAGDGKAIARPIGGSGIATLGTDDAAAWWSGRIAAGKVHFPRTLTRADLADLAAAEALTAEGGALRWRPVEGRSNHRWDSALLAIHARHFRTLTVPNRRRLVAV